MKKLVRKEFKKGDYITPEELEKELGYLPTGLQLLAICQSLDDTNNGITIKSEDGGIRFLTDGEATNYNHSYFGRHVGGLMRRNKKMLSVDQGKLSKDEKTRHKRRLEVQAATITGVRDSLRQFLPLKPYSSDIKKLF